mgnify:CR=1 FL=1
MKENTYIYKDFQINENEYLRIIKSKLDNKHFKISGYLYEIETYLNNDMMLFSKHFEDYKEFKKELKEDWGIKIIQKDFKEFY